MKSLKDESKVGTSDNKARTTDATQEVGWWCSTRVTGSAISSSQSIGNSYFFTVLIRKYLSTVQNQ